MKKFSAILLAVLMMLSMTAMAASITITPPVVPEGATETNITYTAYKIFDATISGENVSYTIDNTSPYFTAIQKASNYFTLTQVGKTNTHVVTVNTSAYTAEAADTFADTLKAVTATAAGTLTKQDDGKYKLDNLADGYYLVTSSVGSDLILDTIGDIAINAKNEYPTITKKVENKETTTADMGEVLTFTIDVTIPEDAVGEIVVHDKMTGLEYQSMTAVEGITAATTALTDDCAVHFTLSADYVAANKSKTVTITYTAKVTADIANNEAWLVDGTFTSTKDETKVYSTDVVINKTADDGDADSYTGAKLAGAKFVLKNSEGKFYKVDTATGAVSWVENQTDATVVTTDDKGAATFANIADGTYSLIETEAPAGYNLLTAPVSVIVNATTTTDANSNTTVVPVTANVENSTGSELPSTGGMGTTLFYVVGSLMMAAAVVVLVAKKKVAAK